LLEIGRLFNENIKVLSHKFYFLVWLQIIRVELDIAIFLKKELELLLLGLKKFFNEVTITNKYYIFKYTLRFYFFK